tara:strand:+ start:417 stop:1520 length:1104 start_codon:yes stop_codon:yes gene_type:complete
MSDLTGILPGQALANISQRGQDRLSKAQGVLKEAIGKEQLTKGLEGGLGGLKATTFGKDIAKSAYDRFGTYFSQEGRKALTNVVEKAKNALNPADDAPIQMSEIGEVEETADAPAAESAAAAAPAEATAQATADSSLVDGLGRFNAENYTGSAADNEAVEGVLTQRFAALPAEAQASARVALNEDPALQVGAVRRAGQVGSEERLAAQSARLQGRSDIIKDAEDEVEADKAEVEGEDYVPPRPSYAPKPAQAEAGEEAGEEADAVEQAEGAPELPAVDYTAGSGAEGATANLAAEGEAGGIAESTTTAEVGLTETVGGILDDTGILAPLGLIAGAVGIGLGLRKSRNPPTLHNVRPVQSGGYSYQVL